MRLFIALALMTILNSCTKSGGEEPPPTNTLDKATLIAPAKDAACISGSNISDTTSRITFDWNDVTGAEKFEVHLKNLLTGITSSHTITKSELQVDLMKSTPYSWFVTSFASGSAITSNSDTWKFYNAGDGIESFAPFPAETTFPTENAVVGYSNDFITLKWSASDADNDIENFEIYFGEALPLSKVGSTNYGTAEYKVSVSKGKSYVWQVVSNDKNGNSSRSDLFHFTIN